MCGRLMSPAHETQSMREIRLLRRRLPRKGGGLTGMTIVMDWFLRIKNLGGLELGGELRCSRGLEVGEN